MAKTWEVGEGAGSGFFQVSLVFVRARVSPTESELKQGGERVPGCQRLGRKNQAEASADVDAPGWRCISQDPIGGSEAAHSRLEGH